MTRFRLRTVIPLTLFLLAAFGRSAHAQAPYYNIPVYDAEAKRYFMLVDARLPGSVYPRNEGLTWEGADEEARARLYKGVHGRLAIVDSIEVHEFLLRTFHADVPAWIGLRYLCRTHRLLKADGSFMNASSFKAWDPVWNQDTGGCQGKLDTMRPVFGEIYMPVAYYAHPTFDWVAKGWAKRYLLYFVEFPTGHP